MLNNISENIWIFDGSTVSFYGFPFSTRMTIIRLSNNDLWIHSPIKICQPLIQEISSLGKVKHIVSPNKIHHLFIQEWIKEFPDAKSYASPGLAKKRNDIEFTKELGMSADESWENEIDQTIFRGSSVMKELVFFHRSSKTLILADLIENIKPQNLTWWLRIIARIGGVLSPNGKTPADWRLSFMFGKKEARESLAHIIRWNPDNIVIAHGECIFGNGSDFIKKSFSWCT